MQNIKIMKRTRTSLRNVIYHRVTNDHNAIRALTTCLDLCQEKPKAENVSWSHLKQIADSQNFNMTDK